MDEQELAAQAKRGDLASFNRLVEAHQNLAYNVAYRLLGEEAEACDATQEAFLSAYRALAGFRGGSFRAWLLRIVTNACYDLLRARARRPAESLEALAERGEKLSWAVAREEAPEDYAERRELEHALEETIAELPPDQRTLVVLVDIQGLNYQEASEVTGASLGTVKSRLNRARLRLRDRLMERKELLPSLYRLNGEG